MGAKEEGVKTLFRFDHRIGPVLVEKVQIQQVLLNLMRNAIEAMHDCERKELLVTTAAAPKDMVEVSVANSGIGLSEEIADRLFQPFVTTKPAGMGVGLSISKRILEAHGGEIWANPIPVAVPCSASRWNRRPARALPMSGRHVIHIVDDDDAVRQSLVFLLSSAGLAVRVYNSATAFLASLRRHPGRVPDHRCAHARHDRHRVVASDENEGLQPSGHRHHRPWRCVSWRSRP